MTSETGAPKQSYHELLSLSYYKGSAVTTPSGRDNKSGWYDIHQKHVNRSLNSKTILVLIGDSIVAGLSRYANIWRSFFKTFDTLNYGIGGDCTQHVLWRAENATLPNSLKYVVIHCGTNNIDRDQPRDIANGVIAIELTLQEKCSGLKVIVTGLFSRDPEWSHRRKKIKLINYYLKKLCRDNFNEFYFIKQDDDWTDKDGNLDEKLYYTDQLHLIEVGNRKFACSILKILSKLMQDEKVHAGDFNIKDHDFPPLSCNMSVRNFLPSSDRSCKLVCANYVCKSKPVTTSNVRKCKLITVSNTRTSKPIRESKPVSTNVSNSTPLIVSCSVSISKPVRSCPIRTNKPVVSSNVHPCKRVRTSNICKSKPVSTNVSNSTPSIGSCSVSKSKPVHSCPIRTNEPILSGNFRPCKRVRTSNACKHKSRNHSSKYKRNYLSLFLFFSAVFLEFLLLGIFVNNNFNFLSSNAFYNNMKFLYEAHSNFVYKNHQNFLQSNYSNVFNTFFPFNLFYILKILLDFTNYVNLVFDIYYYLKILGNTKSFTKSLLTFIFFISFDFLPLNTLTLSSNSKKENTTKLNSDFLDTFLWVFNLNAHIQSIRYKVFSLCQHFSSFWFYMFENFVDFLIFLDFLLLFIGGIFKYLFLLFLPLLIYLFFTLTIIFNSLFIDHNVFDNNFTFLESNDESISNDFLLIKNQTIPASISHNNTIASYNSLIFYSVVMSFSCNFYKKHNFNCAK